jgi:metallo-beta-lactamase family protein
MLYSEIIHHGATQGVTGSCHQMCIDAEHSFLIDCGLFQGSDVSNGKEAAAAQSAVLFSLKTIKALIVTHVHADHIGRIPQLLAAGFSGPILCSEPSAQLMPLVLEEAFRLQFGGTQKEADQYLEFIAKRAIALPFNTWFELLSSPELDLSHSVAARRSCFGFGLRRMRHRLSPGKQRAACGLFR